ncbi:DUF3267 domain-containing protein [Halapricum hydrolyticum]|uniref:DUF3267 domain-containing protein n=1 Tax=Halapricum hydrolyticum TaxID=2979991 RepID=A0AAE3IBK1_9EURY|nr:DUF3267 domain-containing protein [Halapricum hydrolyticum]MCU4716856.1 DUF3267 domain-containing protein [Halapricum hydrolyticum]MCU4725539.1 DUF3267 domain-containing protein [Halapricum hydrolyticum]
MSEHWPPDGYSNPKRYEVDDRYTILIAVAVTPPVLAITAPELEGVVPTLISFIQAFGQTTGIANYPLLYLATALFVVVGWVAISGASIVAIHEAIHYVVALLNGSEPEFIWTERLGLKSPGIMPYGTGLTRGENIAGFLAPFILLSAFAGSIMLSSDGIVAGTAAAMFAINSIPSCSDIYNSIKVARMPRGTKYANFDNGEGIKSEYALPKDAD